jgi:hypothetical protein
MLFLSYLSNDGGVVVGFGKAGTNHHPAQVALRLRGDETATE